ncbi:SpoIIE family protein phosphatase [Streptomyces sp. NPDC060194]|uniref:SpoIIE family protein phosphatase n=1 Tax=Streptomyces sp. NPDC060194 TaxID=3347069 RepID=UPI00364D1A95
MPTTARTPADPADPAVPRCDGRRRSDPADWRAPRDHLEAGVTGTAAGHPSRRSAPGRSAMAPHSTPSTDDARSRLDLQAIGEMLDSQNRRIASYARRHWHTPRHTPAPTGPAPLDDGPGLGQTVLEALPMGALLLAPVFAGDGTLRDVTYLTRNARAREGLAARLPPDVMPPWTGPVSLFERHPNLAVTAIPRMLTDAARDGTPQGPETVQWMVSTPSGPVRINDEVRIAPCGEHYLLTWEPGNRIRMATAAQRLVRVCWAEWNLGDDGVQPSHGFREVLGLAHDAPVPGLYDLAATATQESLPAYYRLLYDVVLRKRATECELRFRDRGERVFRMVAEPVRIAPSSLVWALRAVLVDVTTDRMRREAADRAERAARRERERTETVAEIADALREAVLPHFHDGLDRYGLETAAVYRPDAREAGVGGDWYKARKLPDGRLLVALGDARGHGLDAATLMAKLRYALAGLAYTHEPVEQLTHWLNEVACADGDESTATAIIARYHPDRGVLRWTSAGHPLPVLVRDGTARTMPPADGGSGLTLGVMSDVPYPATASQLEDGDIVLMYSDGLTERRGGDPDDDVRRFLRAAEACVQEAAPRPGHGGLQDYTERLVTRLDGPHRTDDATLLALRRVAT